MDFSVVDRGCGPEQVDSFLCGLGDRLSRTAQRAEAAAEIRTELECVRTEVDRLRAALVAARPAWSANSGEAGSAEREAAALLVQARNALLAAQEEARQVRDQAYDEALQARRDFEAALYARRLREERVDQILRRVATVGEPEDDQAGSAPSGPVPATRSAGAA